MPDFLEAQQTAYARKTIADCVEDDGTGGNSEARRSG
jgi:hypothetical protein